MIGAYTAMEHFAYPGWRLTVPGGPAGGHYKGFTHTEATGTDIPPGDSYEQDREDGMSSHDPVHASPRNPRGVYRSSAEVPPRPNASGAAMTYRGFQTRRHPGTSISPGSFPAPFVQTEEDAFLAGLGAIMYDGGAVGSEMIRAGMFTADGPATPIFLPPRPNVTPQPYPIMRPIIADGPGATSVVNQPPPIPLPLPPSPAVPVFAAPPVSPRPAPVVATHEVIPDGSGNWINVSTGEIVPAGAVEQNPATGQVTAARSAMSWLEEHSIWSALPNWGVLAIGLVGASMFLGRRR